MDRVETFVERVLEEKFSEGRKRWLAGPAYLIAISDEYDIALIPSPSGGKTELATISLRMLENSVQRNVELVCIKRLEPGTQTRNDGRIDGRSTSDVA